MRQRGGMKRNKAEKFTAPTLQSRDKLLRAKRKCSERERISALLSMREARMHLNKCWVTLKPNVAGIGKYPGRICDPTWAKGEIQAPFAI